MHARTVQEVIPAQQLGGAAQIAGRDELANLGRADFRPTDFDRSDQVERIELDTFQVAYDIIGGGAPHPRQRVPDIAPAGVPGAVTAPLATGPNVHKDIGDPTTALFNAINKNNYGAAQGRGPRLRLCLCAKLRRENANENRSQGDGKGRGQRGAGGLGARCHPIDIT